MQHTWRRNLLQRTAFERNFIVFLKIIEQFLQSEN